MEEDELKERYDCLCFLTVHCSEPCVAMLTDVYIYPRTRNRIRREIKRSLCVNAMAIYGHEECPFTVHYVGDAVKNQFL